MKRGRLRCGGQSVLVALLGACAGACSPEATARTEAWRPARVEAGPREGWAGVVTGILRGPGEGLEPLQRVRVELCQADSMVTDTVTDRDGVFTLRAAGLRPGAFLRFGLPGGNRFYRSLELSGDLVELGIVTAGQERRLEGLAIREGGEPIPEATLTLCAAVPKEGLYVTTRTDSQGRFHFGLGIEGPAVLWCAAGGVSDRAIPVPEETWGVGAQPWIARFPGMGDLFLEIMDVDGEPLEDVRVHLEPRASRERAKRPDPIFFPSGSALAPRVEQTNLWGVAIFRRMDDVPWDAQLFDGARFVGSAKGLRIGKSAQRLVITASGEPLR